MRKPSPALVIATVALFFSLTGWGVAAKLALSPNSVGTQQIVNGSIRLTDIAPATAVALRGQVGPQGPPGLTGPQGLQGPAATGDAFKISGLEGRMSIAERKISTICPSIFSRLLTGVSTAPTGQLQFSYVNCP